MAKQFQLGETAAKQLADVVRFAGRQPRNPRARRRRGPVGVSGASGFRALSVTLPSALTASDTTVTGCTVTEVWSGADPGTTVDITNELGFEADAGSTAYVIYSSATSEWKIIQTICPVSSS